MSNDFQYHSQPLPSTHSSNSSSSGHSHNSSPRRPDGQHNQIPTRINTFLRYNRNNKPRLILTPLIYFFLAIFYFYNLLFRDVGSGIHARQAYNATNTAADMVNTAHTIGGKVNVPLEPRSLADVAIANAEITWKKRKEREEYLKQRAEIRRRQVEERKRMQEERRAALNASKIENGTNSNVTLGAGGDTKELEQTLFKALAKNSSFFDNYNRSLGETDAQYVKRIASLSVKRTKSKRKYPMGAGSSGSAQGDAEFLPFLIIITTCSFFRLCLSATIGRLAEDGDLNDSDREDEEPESDTTGLRRGGLSSFMTSFRGGRDAVRLRRRARAARANRQFQNFVDRLNAQRVMNGERQISADSLRLVVSSRDFNGNDYDRLWQFNEENGPAFGSLFSSIGATEAEINRCPSRTLEQNDDLLRPRQFPGLNEGEKQTCSVCLEPYQVGDKVRTIPCFHTFHAACIDPWLSEKAECPVCKHSAIG